jgi:hypothetical protein
MKRFLMPALFIAAIYLGSYFIVRATYAEVWSKDGRAYVLFPNSLIYYLYRPLSYLDATLTEMRFHIGAHQ